MLPSNDPTLARAATERDWRVCTVTALAPLTVRENLTGDTVQATNTVSNWVHAIGDRVLVQRVGDGATRATLVRATMTTRPTRGTVLSVAAGVASVSAGGVVMALAYVGAAPAAEDVVRISWDAEGGTVIGVISTTATPAADVAPIVVVAPSPRITLDLVPTASATYRSGTRDSYSGDNVVQGYWTGGAPKTGVFVYGDTLGGVAGMTCESLEIDLTRATGSGVSGAHTVHLWLHNVQSLPGTTPTLIGTEYTTISLAPGQSGRFALLADWGTQMAAQTAAGVAIYVNGSADYMTLHPPTVNGSGTLHGTFI